MNCECGGETRVINTRTNQGQYVRRRRECEQCGGRFTTYETKEEIGVTKGDVAQLVHMVLGDLAAKGRIEVNL